MFPFPGHYWDSYLLFRFWRSYNDHLLAAEQQTSQLASLRAAYAAGLMTLEKLERTNVYNDAFCIGHDGVFGTINGLRLGRVPGVPVSISFGFANDPFIRLLRLSGQKSTPPGVKPYYFCTQLLGSSIIHLSSMCPGSKFCIYYLIQCTKQLSTGAHGFVF